MKTALALLALALTATSAVADDVARDEKHLSELCTSARRPPDSIAPLVCQLAAINTAASRFDNFARHVVGKTIAEVAQELAKLDRLPFSPAINLALADTFTRAAKGIGLAPKSQLTREILSDPLAARALAGAVGIGADLSEEQWREAHAIASWASRARQAKTNEEHVHGGEDEECEAEARRRGSC
jgi:hypothetical protein